MRLTSWVEWSRSLPGLLAANSPPGTPRIRPTMIDNTASSIVFGSAWAVIDSTLCLEVTSKPKLPVNRPPSQSKYWTTAGLFSP